uniref:Uncharacterized protein n=1 Tax=viral metagenome TaxID=1070528 RepID=A0A6C0DC47_9ZZZZ
MGAIEFFKNSIIMNIEKTKERTTEIKSIAINKIQKYELDVKAFEWFLFCINQSNKVVIYFDHIYETNPKVQKVTDHFIYFFRYVYSAISNQKIEPMKTNWICTSVLMKRNTNLVGEEIYFNDTYEYMNTNEFMDTLKESCGDISSIVASTDNILEGMVTMKMGDQYINRIFFNKNEAKVETELPLVPSKHRFISVKYTHPNMDEPIFIDIDKEYYYANNEILSPLFIKRYLEYQPLVYDFNMDYEVEIIDNDINNYKITSKQYILLADSTYVIKNIE